MSLTQHDLDNVIQQLQQPGVVSKSGQFIVFFAHGRWHLMTTQYMGVQGKPDSIRTVHFMDEVGARRYFKNFIVLPEIQPFSEMFLGFSEEVGRKVLPKAKHYLELLERGELQASTGFTTDTTHVSDIGARGKKFITTINQAMKHEVLGFALQFTK